MLFTRDMTEAFGDWLEREQIHQALVSARPELGGSLTLDEERPLLRIPRSQGADVLVAKTADDQGADEQGAGWIVGIADPQSPIVHEADSLDGVVRRVLDVLGVEDYPTEGGDHPEA